MIPLSSRGPQRPPLNTRELLIIVSSSVTVLWSLWALGGARTWAMTVTGVLAAITFLMLYLPLGRGLRGTAALNLRHTLRAPIFWIGLGLNVYVLVQGLNACYTISGPVDGQYLILRNEYVTWLPSGISAPMDMQNTWRMLLMLGSAWLVSVAVWVGLRRRAAHVALLWVLAANALVWGAVGMAQQFTGSTHKLLWVFDPPFRNFRTWGTLNNENHAAALLNLGLIAALTLFMHGYARGRDSLLKGSATLLSIPVAMGCLAGCWNTNSRAGIVIALAILAAFMFVGAMRATSALWRDPRGLVVVCVGFVLVGIFAVGAAYSVDRKAMLAELSSLRAVTADPEKDLRYYLNQATIDLIKERPVFGWGMGSYPHYIYLTQSRYEPLAALDRVPPAHRRVIRYAHNDYLQYLAELGWVGYSFVLMFFLFAGFTVLRALRRAPEGAFFFATIAMGLFMLHPAVEFFFYSPALLNYFVLLSTGMLRLMDLHGARSRRIRELSEQVQFE